MKTLIPYVTLFDSGPLSGPLAAPGGAGDEVWQRGILGQRAASRVAAIGRVGLFVLSTP